MNTPELTGGGSPCLSTPKSGRNSGGKPPCGNLSRIANGFTVGIINNTPTADELEAKARSGEQISLAEYAAALNAEKEQGKKAEPGKKPEKKPSIRAQLRADKERAAQKKQAKSKSQDLERS